MPYASLEPPDENCTVRGAVPPVGVADAAAVGANGPVAAIFHEDEVPEAWKEFVALNREMAATCSPITDRKEPLAGRGEQR